MENVCNENNICADSKNHEKFSQLTLKSQKRLAIYRCVPIIGKQSPTFETKKKKNPQPETSDTKPDGHRQTTGNLYAEPGLEIDTTQPEAPIQSQMGIGE